MKNYLYQVIDRMTAELRSAGFTTVTFGDATEIDLNKQNTFPIAHIILPDSVSEINSTTFTFNIICVDIVDFQKEYTNTLNSTFDVDNVQDVLQDLIARMQHAYKWVDNDTFINLNYPVNANSFKENFTNGVAGWTFTLRFTTPNMADLCANNLE